MKLLAEINANGGGSQLGKQFAPRSQFIASLRADFSDCI